MAEYITRAEIAEDLGLAQRYVTARLVKRPDFPKPAMALTRKTVLYKRADYMAWKSKSGKRAAQ